MSAWMHVFVSPDVPLRCNAWPQMRFYFSIAGAIVLEDIVIIAYRHLTKKTSYRTKPKGHAIEQSAESKINTGLMDEKHPLDNQLERRKTHSSSKYSKVQTQPPNDLAGQDPMTPESTPRLFRVLGYIWVASFEVWSTSKFLYLTQQCMLQ